MCKEGKETFVIVSRGKSLKITFEEKKYAASVVARPRPRPRPRELLRKKRMSFENQFEEEEIKRGTEKNTIFALARCDATRGAAVVSEDGNV